MVVGLESSAKTSSPEVDEVCINTIRFLAIDAVQNANSGHPGLPMGAAPNGIACQQLTLTLGILLLDRLASLCGPALDKDGQCAHAFPRPEDLANCDSRTLRRLGFSLHKAQAIVESARAICDGQLNLEALADVSDDAAVAFLRELRGVGRWTAEYVLLRGQGRWHVFPGDDVGARNSLVRWLGLSASPDYEEVHRRLARWSGYGGLLYFHLLLNRLAQSGCVP
jgi:DNA-3-methyladenine glycosylase II